MMATFFDLTRALRCELAYHPERSRVTFVGVYRAGDHLSVLRCVPSLHAGFVGPLSSVDIELDRMVLLDRLATQSLVKLAVQWSAARKARLPADRYAVQYVVSARDREQAHAARVIVSMDPLGAHYCMRE